MYTELDVINACLATLGMEPLNQIDENRPFVAAARKEFNQQRTRLNSRGWWYNKEYLELSPDALTKRIIVPGDTITIGPIEPKGLDFPYVLRGRELYDTKKGTFEFDVPVKCKLVRNLTFDKMPITAQQVVFNATELAFQKNYDGDSNRYQQIGMQLRESMTLLNRDEINNAGVNLLYSNALASRMHRGLGNLPFRNHR